MTDLASTNEPPHARRAANRGFVRRRLPIAIAVTAAVVVAMLAAACGGKGSGTPTPSGPTATPTPGQNIGLQTPIAFSADNALTDDDLAKRGTGTPGRGDFTGDRLLVPSVGIDAPIVYKAVGGDGVMPNPKGPEEVAYYDFAQWQTLGGLPGAGGNIVMAGHVDYINYGPAVFWKVRDLQAGDMVTIRMTDGTEYNYKIEFNKQVPGDYPNWNAIVSSTEDESVTLITCTGEFEAGHYNNRQVAWGRRV
jgi:LPXTG-site transpeptidase (sortase) family protein